MICYLGKSCGVFWSQFRYGFMQQRRLSGILDVESAELILFIDSISGMVVSKFSIRRRIMRRAFRLSAGISRELSILYDWQTHSRGRSSLAYNKLALYNTPIYKCLQLTYPVKRSGHSMMITFCLLGVFRLYCIVRVIGNLSIHQPVIWGSLSQR